MNDKEIFNLKEVSEIVGVGTHIILYWETEFLQVKPERDELRQRVYSRRNLDVIIRIHHLLFEERRTIADTKIELAKEFP